MTTGGDQRPGRMPAIFLSHGAPPLADDAIWTKELAAWSSSIEMPSAILIVSAHWEEAPLTLGATTTVPLTYDFWGFEARYYQVRYPAPGAPQLATEVSRLLHSRAYPMHQEPLRGLDHGAYVPLVEMYPAADIPVLQVSMPTLDPGALLEIGRRIAPLRDQGVLIIGSGFSTHNLGAIDPWAGFHAPPPPWSAEFDDWLEQSLAAGDVDGLVDFKRKAPAAMLAHPRTEHFAPLFVALGASLESGELGKTVIDGFFMGLSKRSVQFG
jgi:4,5-DOPA dioxygenase extradiol